MSFRMVPKWVTLDNFERRNSHNRSVISTNSLAFAREDYAKVVEHILILSEAKVYAKESSF